MNYLVLAKEVEALFEQMSLESQEYQAANVLACKPDCGQCCDNPEIESSPIEMLPLALKLSQKPDVALTLKALEGRQCIFFKNEGQGQGRCQSYAERGVVCRLFGWTSVNTKRGREMSICPLVSRPIEMNKNAPSMSEWAWRVRSLEPSLGAVMPINQALKVMLEKVLLSQQFGDYRR